jgi:uncharacterized protein (TIGR02186 family)
MSARHSVILGVLTCGACLVSASGTQAEPKTLPVVVEPARVEIGFFYSGVDLTVSADPRPGVDVAVLVTGPASELVMRTQARRWGLFWAPAGEVTFEGVPSLYLLRTTAEPERLAPPHVLKEWGIGYEALRPKLGAGVREELLHELIQLKESEGLFSSLVDKREARALPRAAGSSLQAVLHVPARAPASAYSVQLLAFRDGQVVGRGEGAFELARGGFVEFVASLAETHGLAYGVLAVVVAVASGLLVGLLFGSARKKT